MRDAPAEPLEIDVEAAPLEELHADLLQLEIPDESRLQGVEVYELRLPSSAIVDRGWSRAILREGLRDVLIEKFRTTVTDGTGVDRAARVLDVLSTPTSHQIRFEIPTDTALGVALVTVTSGDGSTFLGSAPVF